MEIIYINIINGDFYAAEYLEKTNTYVYGESAPRGRILDVNGNVLVDNEEVYVINYVNGNDDLNVSYILADILSDVSEASDEECAYFLYLTTDTSELLSEEEKKLYSERKLSDEEVIDLKLSRIDVSDLSEIDRKAASIFLIIKSGYSYDKKTIVSDISYEEFAFVSELNLEGVLCEVTYERVYPYGDVLKSILGSVGPIYEESSEEYLNLGYALTDTVGVSYLEYEYESILKGEKAVYKVSEEGLTLIKEAVIGNDLYLSIDIEVQLELESIMESEMILAKNYQNTEYFTDSFAAVSDPLTGEIIAISGKRLIDNSKNYSFTDITNEILTSSFTIGSVVKAASMSVGYNNDLIDETEYITDSCVKLYYVPEKCSWKSLGSINDISALKLSSNYYQYLIAIKLTGNTYSYNMEINATEEDFSVYRDTFAEFGLGSLTGIDLPGETTGVTGETVADDLLLNLAIGQYDTYTLLGILQYINTIANNKERLELSLASYAYNYNEELVFEKNNKILNTLTVSDYYYERILEGLSAVVSSGTGYGYISSKYNPVGKTGTSESFLDTDNDGQIDTETYTKTFVGYGSYNDKTYSVAVITPHISFKKTGDDDYIYNLSRYISLNITNFLFENT